MGGPELPNDPGDDDLRSAHIVHHPPAPNDDSDNESITDAGDYEGYQPLAMDEHHTDFVPNPLDGSDSSYYNSREDSNWVQENTYIDINEPVEHVEPNMPQIEPADVQIEREIWNQPRPRELQIELDGNRTQQILNAMANFQLPNLAIPDWAAGVPEERWKEELLQRIRQRKPSNGDSKMEVDKESK